MVTIEGGALTPGSSASPLYLIRKCLSRLCYTSADRWSPTLSLIPMATWPTRISRRSRILTHSPCMFSIQMSTPAGAHRQNTSVLGGGAARATHLPSSRRTGDWPRPTSPCVRLCGCCRRRKLQSSDRLMNAQSPSGEGGNV